MECLDFERFLFYYFICLFVFYSDFFSETVCFDAF